MTDLNSLPALLRDFASYKLTIQGRSEKSVYNYCGDVENFFVYILKSRDPGFKPEEEDLRNFVDLDLAQSVKESDIYSYLLYCASTRKNKPASRARKLSSIRAFYRYLAVNAKLIKNDPAKNIESPKLAKALPKFLTLEESRDFLDAVKTYGGENAVRDTAIFTLFLNCGMRLNELCGIGLSDLTPSLDSIVITGKGSKQRQLYLNESCRTALKKYLDQRAGLECKDKNALWVSRNSNRLTDKAVQYNMKQYLTAAGLTHKKLSVHKLRHTAATLMYQTGKVDVRVLKDILGHEQLNTTQIYTHVSDEQVRNAMMLDPISDKNGNDKKD